MPAVHMFDRAFLQLRPKIALNFRLHLVRHVEKIVNLKTVGPIQSCEISLRGEDLVIVCSSDKTFSGTVNKDFQFKHGLLSSLAKSNPWGRAPLEFGFGSATRTGNRVEIVLKALPDLSPIVGANTVNRVPISMPKVSSPATAQVPVLAKPAPVSAPAPVSEPKPVAAPVPVVPEATVAAPAPVPPASEPPARTQPPSYPSPFRHPNDKLLSEAGVPELLTAMFRKLVGIESLESALATITQRQVTIEESLKSRMAHAEQAINLATENVNDSVAKFRRESGESLMRAGKAADAASAAARQAAQLQEQISASVAGADSLKRITRMETQQNEWMQLVSDTVGALDKKVRDLTAKQNSEPAAAPTESVPTEAATAPQEPAQATDLVHEDTQPSTPTPVELMMTSSVSKPASVRLHKIALVVPDSANKGSTEMSMTAHGINKIADVEVIIRHNKYLKVPSGYDGVVIHEHCCDNVRQARAHYGNQRIEVFHGGHSGRDQAIRNLIAKLPPVLQQAAA